jgi:iron-sulfur cluster repair protein YtfE (RIC family)
MPSVMMKKLFDEHIVIAKILTGISNEQINSPARAKMFVVLRTALISHTDNEVDFVYNKLHNYTSLDVSDLLDVYRKVLEVLEKIIMKGEEQEGDFEFVRDMLLSRVALEEKILFPMYEDGRK